MSQVGEDPEKTTVRTVIKQLGNLSHNDLRILQAAIDAIVSSAATQNPETADKAQGSLQTEVAVATHVSDYKLSKTVVLAMDDIAAAEDAEAVDFKRLDIKPAKPSDFRRGTLRHVSCRNFTQYLIIWRGAMSLNALEKTVGNWCQGVASNALKPSTLRGWLSRWKDEGYICSIEGMRGAYTMTEAQIEEAKRRNPLAAQVLSLKELSEKGAER